MYFWGKKLCFRYLHNIEDHKPNPMSIFTAKILLRDAFPFLMLKIFFGHGSLILGQKSMFLVFSL